MPTIGDANVPYPNASARPDVPADLLLLAQWLQRLSDPVATVEDLPSSGNWTGRHLFVEAAGIEYLWDGLEWVPTPHVGVNGNPYAQAQGVIATPLVNNGQVSGNIPVTFPAGRFTVPPRVTYGTGSARLTPALGSVTKDGCVFTVANWSPAPAGANELTWRAVQMTADSADG